MNNSLFYVTNDKAIITKRAYNNMLNLIQIHSKELFSDENEFNNCKKEIFPIIILANFLNYKKIQFLGHKGSKIDAILKNSNNDILSIECTTSIDFRTKKITSEYNKQFVGCYITPRTKARNLNNQEIQNYSDILYKGSFHKREFIQQNNTLFREGLVDDNLIKQYAKQDIEHINKKVEKGNKDNCYNSFILILSTEHDLPKEKLSFYSNLISDYWIKISNNPFAGLFIVIYDYLMCKEYYKEYYNPSIMPVPIFFYKN